MAIIFGSFPPRELTLGSGKIEWCFLSTLTHKPIHTDNKDFPMLAGIILGLTFEEVEL